MALNHEMEKQSLQPDKGKAAALSRFGGKSGNLFVGLQSTLDSELKMLGRLHDYKTFLDAYAMARECFDNINIDLISGLPGQRPEDFALTLDRVTALEPEHISAYSLILEEGTPLEKEVSSGQLSRPDEETDRQIYALTAQKLLISGYKKV